VAFSYKQGREYQSRSYRAMGRADRTARSERFLQTDSDNEVET